MRIVIAGILGGIAMFIWTSIAHVATPLGSVGLSTMPGEDQVIAALHANLGDKGALYFFPGVSSPTDAKAMAAQTAKMQSGPSGLLAYNPPTTGAMTGRQLGVEFGIEVVEALLTAAVISVATGFWPRWRLAIGIGLIAAVTTNVSYWNWYGFSGAFTLAAAFVEVLKYMIAGAVAAAVLGWRGRAAKAA
jgi:hypothetical protein